MEATDREYRLLKMFKTVGDAMERALDARAAKPGGRRPRASIAVKALGEQETVLDRVDLTKALDKAAYEKEIPKWQARLRELQFRAHHAGVVGPAGGPLHPSQVPARPGRQVGHGCDRGGRDQDDRPGGEGRAPGRPRPLDPPPRFPGSGQEEGPLQHGEEPDVDHAQAVAEPVDGEESGREGKQPCLAGGQDGTPAGERPTERAGAQVEGRVTADVGEKDPVRRQDGDRGEPDCDEPPQPVHRSDEDRYQQRKQRVATQRRVLERPHPAVKSGQHMEHTERDVRDEDLLGSPPCEEALRIEENRQREQDDLHPRSLHPRPAARRSGTDDAGRWSGNHVRAATAPVTRSASTSVASSPPLRARPTSSVAIAPVMANVAGTPNSASAWRYSLCASEYELVRRGMTKRVR